MKSIKQLFRLIHINYILAKNGLDQGIVEIRLFAPLRFIVYLNPWNWFRRDRLSRGVALRKTLEELGPIFIKFGQALSTRPDVLPADIAQELCKLQDSVPPFPSQKALEIIEAEYGQSAFEVFAHFDETVLASASIAQVHAATLKTGEDVVVKILRPGIMKVIEKDLSILHAIANLADRYWAESKRLKPKEIVKEFERSLLDELNMRLEAANAGQLRRNFHRSPLLYVPEVYWDYVRDNILVMERIYGIPVTDLEALKEHNICIPALAERGLEIFFTQVFRDSFFHADMHPGNIFVSYEHPDKPQYICVDFGIIGTLTDEDKRYLAENLVAFFNRDYRRVAQLHVESGWVIRTANIQEFESAIRMVCEPIFEKPLKDISFALLVVKLFQVAQRFQMEVQPQLVLLQKTLLAVEGLGRQLYPDLDLWSTAKPFLEKWLAEQLGVKALLRQMKNNYPFFIEHLPNLPRLIHDVLVLNKEQNIALLQAKGAEKKEDVAKKSWYKGIGAGVFVGLLAFSGMSYLEILNSNQLAVISFLVAMAGGFLTLLNKP